MVYYLSDNKDRRIKYLKHNQQEFEQLALTLLNLKRKGINRLTFDTVEPFDFKSKGISLQEIQQARILLKYLKINYGYSAYGVGDTFYLTTRRLLFSGVSQGYSYINPPPTIDFNCKKSSVIRCNSEEFYTHHVMGNWYIYQK